MLWRAHKKNLNFNLRKHLHDAGDWERRASAHMTSDSIECLGNKWTHMNHVPLNFPLPQTNTPFQLFLIHLWFHHQKFLFVLSVAVWFVWMPLMWTTNTLCESALWNYFSFLSAQNRSLIKMTQVNVCHYTIEYCNAHNLNGKWRIFHSDKYKWQNMFPLTSPFAFNLRPNLFVLLV